MRPNVVTHWRIPSIVSSVGLVATRFAARIDQAEGLSQASPGQRPGLPTRKGLALKGRDNPEHVDPFQTDRLWIGIAVGEPVMEG